MTRKGKRLVYQSNDLSSPVPQSKTQKKVSNKATLPQGKFVNSLTDAPQLWLEDPTTLSPLPCHYNDDLRCAPVPDPEPRADSLGLLTDLRAKTDGLLKISLFYFPTTLFTTLFSRRRRRSFSRRRQRFLPS